MALRQGLEGKAPIVPLPRSDEKSSQAAPLTVGSKTTPPRASENGSLRADGPQAGVWGQGPHRPLTAKR